MDTNVILSGLLFSNSVPSKAINRATELGTIAVSEEVVSEYREVFARKKFDRFIGAEERRLLLNNFLLESKYFEIEETITECTDAKDNKFLEVGVAASAACLVTGDNALLVLHPFRTIPILNAADFLRQF
ncbi:putative toxin-antitoxin system toxin component, PIN family [Tunicatimonas pelagia]|uniref:putative toxin-antitoxin system toxin component, PIN family n=1 Tax=Tunicatimonas pelagia TaxID=931531 RepID=UPI002665A6AD|nr:putative toxin-antitoxin system toxin component, PIN family [Tunicatimonas pelagia]WKN43017.1 putative toxin-antitoxin system toxin component, PIN family [Tunicatimonas pelagia]